MVWPSDTRSRSVRTGRSSSLCSTSRPTPEQGSRRRRQRHQRRHHLARTRHRPASRSRAPGL